MMGVWPLTPTLSFFFVMTMSRSRPFRLPATGTVTSTSPIVWVHLYGSFACSSASLAFASLSFCSCSSGLGDISPVENFLNVKDYWGMCIDVWLLQYVDAFECSSSEATKQSEAVVKNT